MHYKSRWEIEIPNIHLASLLLGSPTATLSKKQACFFDASQPETLHLTLHDLRLWSQRFAAGLQKAGLGPGDRVLLFSGNALFFPVVFLGVIMAGGIFTAVNPSSVERELAYQITDSGAKFLLCAPEIIATGMRASQLAGLDKSHIFVFDDKVTANNGYSSHSCHHWGELISSLSEGQNFIWEEFSSADKANQTIVLNYSSGTTGRAKGVEITHKNYVSNTLQLMHLSTLDPDYTEVLDRSRWLCFLPMYHAMAQTIFIAGALWRRTPVYIMRKFSLSEMLGHIEAFRITDLILVPSVASMMMSNPKINEYDLNSVESLWSGAAPLGANLSREVEGLWPDRRIQIKQGWGMTETTSSFLNWDPTKQSNPSSVGELIANCEAKIMTLDGTWELSQPQARGELWVRGPNVMKGYWRNLYATNETKTADGWLRTGDIAFADNKGNFYIVDRIKELIKVKGSQVAPAELESLLIGHQAVSDAAVVGVRINDDECPRAYIVLKPGMEATGNGICSYIEKKVSKFKRLTGGVVFVDSIPRNPSGKILRRVLRDEAKMMTQADNSKL